MQQYLALGQDILTNGNRRSDRTGTGTISVFGRQMRFNLQEGFSLLTTKKVFLRGIIEELIWFLAGDTNIHYLKERKVKIWDEWATEAGDLGPIYGHQWRNWPNPKGATLETKTPQERLAIAYHWVDQNEDNDYAYPISFTREQVDRLARVSGLSHDCPEVVPVVHETLTKWGVPGDRVQEHPVDQIKTLIENLKRSPYSRRHIVSAWNVADLPDETLSPQENVRRGKMALAPCHTMFQFYVEDMTKAEITSYVAQDKERYSKYLEFINTSIKWDSGVTKKWCENNGVPTKKLSCQLYQRSADFCLGVPFNIASYALLTMMIAQVAGMASGDFVHTFGDVHVYLNHEAKLREQLTREPYPLPTMRLNPDVKDIFSFKYEDFTLENYVSHPAIDYGAPAI